MDVARAILIICLPDAHISGHRRPVNVDFCMGRRIRIQGQKMTPKPEQTRWASQEAAIKAEINEAKNTRDLLRMANAIVQLDALQSEMQAGRARAPQISRTVQGVLEILKGRL